jgi:alkanesulfonate monooxygenase SsuD/methylene tetrahydromethanopterin reductase-like flavin-dependent oxidoreductase (luciferase family)
MQQARSARAAVRALATSHGRDPDSIRYLPGLYAVVGSTEEEANRKFDALNELLNFDHELIRVAEMLGLDPAGVSLDTHLPDGPTVDPDSYNLSRGFLKIAWERAREGNPTFRELVVRNVTGHRQIVGAPEQIADNIQAWFETQAADGFVLNFTTVPDGLSEFVDHVVPMLRKRGLFRAEYPGNTLRDSFGLPYPTDRR